MCDFVEPFVKLLHLRVNIIKAPIIIFHLNFLHLFIVDPSMSLFFWILPFPTVFHLRLFLDSKGSLHVLPLGQSSSDSSFLAFVFHIPTYCPVSHLFLYFYSDFLSTVLNLSPLPVTPENKAYFHFSPISNFFLVQILVKITGLFLLLNIRCKSL